MGTELVYRDELEELGLKNEFDNNSWRFLKQNEKDQNFLLVYQQELSLNIDKSLNRVYNNTYKQKAKDLRLDCFDANEVEEDNFEDIYVQIFVEKDGYPGYLQRVQLRNEECKILSKHKHELIDFDHPNIGHLHLIKALNLDNIHPMTWFAPFNKAVSMNFGVEEPDLKKVKVRKRCIVCKKRKKKAKIRNSKNVSNANSHYTAEGSV